MSTPCPITTPQVDALDALMGEEEALLDLRRGQLASLAAAIIDRDDDAVERLLEQVEQAQRLQAATDKQLDDLRADLAKRLACDRRQVRLSALIERLPDERRDALAARRERIIHLAERLQWEHVRTVKLLRECARINRMLLESLCPQSRALTTYSAAGCDAWRPGTGLVDSER